MAGPRGYHSYRGRASKGKIVLAAALVIVILAALCVMGMQRYIVYGEDGRPRFELPWQEEQTEPAAEDPLDITIQKTEKTPALKAVQLPQTEYADWQWERLTPYWDEGSPLNALAVTVKDGGRVYYDSAAAKSATGQTAPAETLQTLKTITEDSRYSIARLSCFLDPRAARADVEGMGLKNTGGYIFYDGDNENWLDPGKPAARAYLCGLARELAEIGFDEILLTDVGYPTAGKLDKIDYGETMKSQNLTTFLEEMRAALEPFGAALAVELPEAVVIGGSDNIAGLLLTDIAPRVDRIYAVTAPDQAGALAAAVAAAGKDTDFVPEFSAAAGTGGAESYLQLAE